MNSVNVTTPPAVETVKSRLSFATVLEKVQQGFSLVSEVMKQRFEEGREEFFFILEREKNRPRVAKASANPAPTRRLRLSGFLISTGEEKSLPLYEGTNHFRLQPSGELEMCQPESHADFHYEIRLAGDQTMFEDFEQKRQRPLFTNDQLELGGKFYFVKMLPESIRSEKTVTIGGMR